MPIIHNLISYENKKRLKRNRSIKDRLLIFIVAYNAETTIENVLQRIPVYLCRFFDMEVLIIDDASKDNTVSCCNNASLQCSFPYRLTVLVNPENQGYGGNQKLGFKYAIKNNFDYVALIHGDGQYAPECLTELIQPLITDEADAVFGSRMLKEINALKGGMPLYKYIGNKILTKFQNIILGSNLSEFHSGYRIYSTSLLRKIPFHLNTNDFHFDTEIIIQILFSGMRIKELPIPTYYGDEICHVNGLKYAFDVFKVTILAYIQKLGIIYNRKFDCLGGGSNNLNYHSKLDFISPHKIAFQHITNNSRVLDIGCGSGHLSKSLIKKNCRVTGIDFFPPNDEGIFHEFYQCDLNNNNLPVDVANFDYILCLDVIEHLRNPEVFVDSLKKACRFNPNVKFIVSTGNIAFFIIRLMLLFGQFNYGKRGILDITHTRLFTFNSFQKLFEGAGFEVLNFETIPAPLPLALGRNLFSKLLMKLNIFLIQLNKNLFSYQILYIVRPKRSLALLLKDARSEWEKRSRTDPRKNQAIAV